MSQLARLITSSGPGSGTVTSISQGTGITLTPNPITITGTVALTVPVTVPDGGTGNITNTAHGVILGEGTSAVAFASPGVSGQVLTSNGSTSDPTFQAVAGTGTVTSISAGAGITLGPSPIISSGSVSVTNPVTATAPTVTVEKSGSGTYSTPMGVVWLAVREVGGGAQREHPARSQGIEGGR